MPEVREAAELQREDAVEVVGREMEPPQVGEVTQFGRNSAAEAECQALICTCRSSVSH